LEDFWLELAESSYNIIPDITTFDYDDKTKQTKLKTLRSASLNAALFGVPKMFIPRWFQINNFMMANFYLGQQQLPWNWTYIYDNSTLGKTLQKYIDFKKISPEVKSSSFSSPNTTKTVRLIVTAVNVLSAEPLIFEI
jgi:NTE family protein